MRSRGVLLALAVLLLAGVSYSSTEPVIQRGIDTFTTMSNGRTFVDFSKSPIPAGFFCKGSPAFTGRVTFRGLPLETGVPGQLRNADTVIERLDDAVFDKNGVAVTRIQFRALSLVSTAPIKTGCGAYHIYVNLNGRQRVTTMKIYRTQEDGGHFVAPLAVDTRLTFIPVNKGRSSRTLQLTDSYTFQASPIPWSFTAGARTKRVGPAVVDTDGDLTPDTRLSGTSNFWPGWTPGRVYATKSCTWCEEPSCHIDPSTGKQHCTGGAYVCYPQHCN